MRLQRLPDGSVCISNLDEWHLGMLQSIPALADPAAGGKAHRRIFPSPFAAGEASPEQLEDWDAFVRPELEELFAGSLDRVAEDVKTARRYTTPEKAGKVREDKRPAVKPLLVRPPASPPLTPPRRPRPPAIRPPGKSSSPPEWSLTIPADHTEDWFRAMNQARLVLSETHEAHRTDNAHITRMFVTGKMETVVHYELLTGLCGWWVEAILSRR